MLLLWCGDLWDCVQLCDASASTCNQPTVLCLVLGGVH